MCAKILETNCFATLLGGGEARDEEITLSLSLAPFLVAADGGANRALEFGVLPELVIGDMDSISEEAKQAISADRLRCVSEQDSTDFDKCLRSLDAPLIVAVGFTGSRIDHQLAVLSCLVKYSDKRCIVLGHEDLLFHCPPELVLDLPVGARLSLFPLLAQRGRSEGLHWPIDGLELAPGGRLGTSNKVSEPMVRIWPEGAGLLVVLPKVFLPQAIAALGANT